MTETLRKRLAERDVRREIAAALAAIDDQEVAVMHEHVVRTSGLYAQGATRSGLLQAAVDLGYLGLLREIVGPECVLRRRLWAKLRANRLEREALMASLPPRVEDETVDVIMERVRAAAAETRIAEPLR